MSDIKMSGVFDLPISYDFDFRDEYGVDYRVIQDAKHKDVISDDTQLSAEQAKAAVHAINTHDAMQARIAELESLIKEADDYLNTNKLTTICNGSILHAAFKEAIKDEKGS